MGYMVNRIFEKMKIVVPHDVLVYKMFYVT